MIFLKQGITIKDINYELPNPSNNVIMMGGGLDSYITLLYMLETNIQGIYPVFVHYGQLSADLELQACEAQCHKHNLRLDVVYDDASILEKLNPDCKLFSSKTDNPVAYGRNLFMVMIGAGYGDTIWLGLDKPMDDKDPFFDCTEDYMVMVATLIGKDSLEIKHPFLDVDKVDAVQYGLDRDPDLFNITFSCWTPINGQACGQCDKCVKNKRLMGITDNMLGG